MIDTKQCMLNLPQLLIICPICDLHWVFIKILKNVTRRNTLKFNIIANRSLLIKIRLLISIYKLFHPAMHVWKNWCGTPGRNLRDIVLSQRNAKKGNHSFKWVASPQRISLSVPHAFRHWWKSVPCSHSL